MIDQDPTKAHALEAPMLFEALAALLATDTGAPGFTASIAFGVDAATPDKTRRWWRADFSDRARMVAVSACPQDVDGYVVVTAEEAQALLTGEPVSLPPDAFVGSQRLIESFLRRYCRRRSMLEVRMAP